MNIIEAIKSGKPFRRATWTNYMETNGSQLMWSIGGLEVCLGPDHILADDWALKPDEPITITKEQYWDAYQDYLSDKASDVMFPNSKITQADVQLIRDVMARGLAQRLGVVK